MVIIHIGYIGFVLLPVTVGKQKSLFWRKALANHHHHPSTVTDHGIRPNIYIMLSIGFLLDSRSHILSDAVEKRSSPRLLGAQRSLRRAEAQLVELQARRRGGLGVLRGEAKAEKCASRDVQEMFMAFCWFFLFVCGGKQRDITRLFG